MTWTVAGGLESVEISKGSGNSSSKVLSVTISNTSMQIIGEAGFASNFKNEDVGALSLQGDFTKINGDDFFAILDQLSVNPSATPTSPKTGDPFASSYKPSGASGTTTGGTQETPLCYSYIVWQLTLVVDTWLLCCHFRQSFNYWLQV